MRVSILVPIYNVEPYIERCVRSLLGQTYDDIEYIFVDDCSPDKSTEILWKVAEEYPERKAHIHVYRNDHNRGLAYCRNQAVDLSTSEFVTIVDSDDWIEDNTIELMVKKQKETDADIVNVNGYWESSEAGISRKGQSEPTFSSAHERRLYYASVIPSTIQVIWKRLIRKSLFTQNNIRAIEGCNYSEDIHLSTVLNFCAERVANVDDYLYHHDKSNKESYTTKIRKNGFSPSVFHEQLTNYMAIALFIKEKNTQYYIAVIQSIEKYLLTRIRRSMINNSREVYDEGVKWLRIIRSIRPKVPSISKKHTVKRFFYCQMPYQFNRGIYKLYHFIKK